MVEYLYEKDLRGMQYNILISTRHDMVISDLAERYGLSKQQMRKVLINRLDMILLENMPARWEGARERGDALDEIARKLGNELISIYIPLVDRETMQGVVDEVKAAIERGIPEESAVEQGKAQIRELILS